MKLPQGSQGVKKTSDNIRHRWNWIGRTYGEKIERSNAFNTASDCRPEERAEDQINQKEHERKWAIPFDMSFPPLPPLY